MYFIPSKYLITCGHCVSHPVSHDSLRLASNDVQRSVLQVLKGSLRDTFTFSVKGNISGNKQLI